MRSLKDLKTKGLPLIWPPLAGVLLSLGLVLPVLRALSLDAVRPAVFACVITGVICALSELFSRRKWIVACVGFLIAAFFVFGSLSRVSGMLSAAVHLARGNGEPLRVYAPELSALLGALFTLIGFRMASQSAGFYPAMSLMMIAALLVWFTGDASGLWLFLPALFVLCALFAHAAGDVAPPPRTLLVSLSIVALALMLSPALTLRSETLKDFSESLRTYITDTFFFTEPRTVYTIQVDGFKPLETRLGGPVNIQDRPVMVVEAPRPILLRGAIYNEYSGLAWGDTMSTRRFLYNDFRNKKMRADTMDELRPSGEARDSGTFELLPIKVTMQADSASTLFAPLRTEALTTPMVLVPYFNTSSEIFITRDLAVGDTYTLQAPVVALDDPRLEGQIARAAMDGENRDMSSYLRLPNVIAEDVFALTARIIQGCETPLQKALAIRSYLQKNFAYTLTPEVPPDRQDFVSFFLLRGKEGYCTYFASAMAVMGRIAGLPTRYVEGYLAEPSGGLALVTSRNAHAWAEVYFDGFGWVSFDATPPRGSGSRQPDSQNQQQEQQEQGGQEQGGDSEQEAQGDTVSPAPEDGAEPSPSPNPSEAEQPPTPSPSPEPENQPEPSPTPSPEPTPPESLDAENPQSKRSALFLWLLLLLLAALVLVREVVTRPETIAKRRAKDDGERVIVYYRGVLSLLAAASLPAYPSESPLSYAERVQARLGKEVGLLEIAEMVTALGYGRIAADPAQVSGAARCYRALHKGVSLRAKAVFTARRMLFGIGNIKSVP